MFCYNKQVGHAILEKRTKLRKCLILENMWMQNHGLIAKKIGEEMKNNLKSPFERQLTKKRPIMNASATSNFFGP
jgi:hypothetical protein